MQILQWLLIQTGHNTIKWLEAGVCLQFIDDYLPLSKQMQSRRTQDAAASWSNAELDFPETFFLGTGQSVLLTGV